MKKMILYVVMAVVAMSTNAQEVFNAGSIMGANDVAPVVKISYSKVGNELTFALKDTGDNAGLNIFSFEGDDYFLNGITDTTIIIPNVEHSPVFYTLTDLGGNKIKDYFEFKFKKRNSLESKFNVKNQYYPTDTAIETNSVDSVQMNIDATGYDYIKKSILIVFPNVTLIEAVEVESKNFVEYDGRNNSIKICYENSLVQELDNFLQFVQSIRKKGFAVDYLKLTHYIYVECEGRIRNFNVDMVVSDSQKNTIINQYLRLNKLGVETIDASLSGGAQITKDYNGELKVLFGFPDDLGSIFPSNIQNFLKYN